ncbi:MAG TPA: HIT domain-containing protein [Pyrinomonadaceae bacterium]|nr:HIT domain-containing protein [Pyrinomonadaceae bacterium]
MNENDCVIYKLVAGELEVSVIHQDDLCVAFMDIQPINRGHALVVPRRHATNLADLGQEKARKYSALLNASQQRYESVV